MSYVFRLLFFVAIIKPITTNIKRSFKNGRRLKNINFDLLFKQNGIRNVLSFQKVKEIYVKIFRNLGTSSQEISPALL